MKALSVILVIIGLLLVVGAVLGKLIGDPITFVGRNVINILIFANTALLLAIVVKLFEKK